MLPSYLKTALRFFHRQKGYTALNVLGLAVGLAAAFFTLLWMQDELRYDRFHEKVDRLYVAQRHVTYSDGSIETSPSVAVPAAAALEAEFPEVEHAEVVTYQDEAVLRHEDRALREEGYWAGAAFFEMFSFPFLAGDPAAALGAPDGIVISERVARVFFGDAQAALGQTIRVDDRADFRVTGVTAAVPSPSTFQFGWVLPFEDYHAQNPWLDHWGNSTTKLYVQLRAGAEAAAVNEKVGDLIRRNHGSATSQLFLQPFGDAHLYNEFENGRQAGGRIAYVRLLGVVALFLVVLACVNFMNLATARAGQRTREIGVRKALGASRGGLAGQFLSEAVLTALGAFVLAVVVVIAALPLFNETAGKTVSLASFGVTTWALFLAVAVGAGLLAGSYPAFVLSRFDSADVLRGGPPLGNALLRKGLVVFQFAASILLIAGTVVAYQQIDYIQTKNLGVDRENVVALTLEGGARAQYDAFKQTLLSHPGIEAVTTSSAAPFDVGGSTTDLEWDGRDPDAPISLHFIMADHGFAEAMGMEVRAGRAFAPGFGADTSNFVVNEAAARAMGMENPVGERLALWGREGQIVGVVRDFHMASLYDPIEPTVLLLETDMDNAWLWLLLVRLAPGQTAEALAGVEQTFARFSPGVPFDYQFLDERYGEMYEAEQRLGHLARFFAAVAALIACLGLFGLAAYAAERRRKEIGVRKVLGASVPSVVGLLSRDFLVLVLLACALALPLAWVGAHRWLSDFAFHAELGAGPFVLAGSVALLLAALTVGAQAYRAATADPVQSLRYE